MLFLNHIHERWEGEMLGATDFIDEGARVEIDN